MFVAPPTINETYFDAAMQKVFGPNAAKRAASLPSIVKSCADQLGVEYFDSSTVCQPAPGDGIHIDEANSEALASALYAKLKTLL